MIPTSNPERDPYITLTNWYEEAVRTEPRVPDAMQLATVDERGFPSIRTVLLKEFSPSDGFLFYTNYNSPKSRHLDQCPHASICFHWKDIRRQVIATGKVERLSRETSEAYFATRNRGSQIGAWASEQSNLLGSREELLKRISAVENEYEGRDIPCPPHWGGFRLIPERIEFWQDVDNRLHHRVVFTKEEDGWASNLLQP